MPEQLTLKIFGSAAGYPTKRRPHTTAIGLWRGDDLYLFDAGAGIAHQYAAHDVGADATRAIFLTHTHADHVGGLAPLLQSVELKKRKETLAVYIPDRSWAGIRDYLCLVYLRHFENFELNLFPVATGFRYEGAGLTVSAVPSYHLVPSEPRRRKLGSRTESQAFSYVVAADGKRIYLSGDIDHPDEAAKNGAGADVAVVEIAHFEPEALGAALAGSGISRLIVTHVPESLEPHEAALPTRIKNAGFEGDVFVATDGLEMEI